MTSLEKSRFQHDCIDCVFLGRSNNDEFDLYYHPKNLESVIARYGSEGCEYKSGLALVGIDEELTEAHKKAVEKGLI